ncbi:hypothetical protein GAY33_10735 [Azospirillum brasilense]|uniref:hypothetical protein n=1 Tax=Azospirillum argentinense TaxID=2970906 RepID=UPI0019097CA1|nr:hypothetical protein [Azospirillum argentinense]MBK3799701.1 hypothetical protein [Azospirillum argentinense]
MTRHDLGTCIYCGSSGPFTDEHVVSAGLGGDDKAWMLKGCVCGKCNTGVFSPLEAKFLRASPAAIARLFLQPHTRDKGEAPTMQTPFTFHHDPENGLLLEARLEAGGTTTILPQLHMETLDRFGTIGTDKAATGTLFARLRALLGDGISLIEKLASKSFRVTPLTWGTDGYGPGEAGMVSRLPKGADASRVWHEPFHYPGTLPKGVRITPRVFLRPEGQIVCRAADVAGTIFVLSQLRRNQTELEASQEQSVAPQSQMPGLHMRLPVDSTSTGRVLAKTGINLCAQLLGVDVVRNHAFDAVVGFAHAGTGELIRHGEPAALACVLGPAVTDNHVLVLFPIAVDGGVRLVFAARLYGGGTECIRLAELPAPLPGLMAPLFVHVDYARNRIRSLSLEEHYLPLAYNLLSGTTRRG